MVVVKDNILFKYNIIIFFVARIAYIRKNQEPFLLWPRHPQIFLYGLAWAE